MTSFNVLSSCPIAVPLVGIFFGVWACARHLRRLADAFRLFGEHDITLVIKRLNVSLPKEETDTPPQEGRPQ